MRWTILCCLTVVGLLLSGCGDSASPPAAAAAPAAPGAPAPPGGPPAPGGEGAPQPAAVAGDGAPAPEGAPVEAPGAPANGEAPPSTLAGGPGAPGGNALPPGGEGPGGQFPGSPGSPGGFSEGQPPGGFADGQPPSENPGEPGAENDRPRRPPPPRTLRDQALAAFRSGNDLGGYKLLNAHFAIVPAAKDELARKMAWYPGLMRPAFAPRIGIGIHVVEVQPLGWKGDPMPIGSAQLTSAVDQMQQAEGADRTIGRTGRASRFARGMKGQVSDMSEKGKIDQTQSWPAAQQIHYYLGDFGDWFVEAIRERMETGEYGPVLQELVKIAPPPRRDPNNPDGQPGDGQSNFAGGEGAPPPPPGEGPPGGGRRGGRGGGGFAGGGNLPGAGAAAGADSGQRRWSTKSDGKPKVDLSPVKQVSPCIVWLGKVDGDERDELNKRAEALDVDVLAVFSMTLHQARTGNFTNNKLLLRLSNLRTGKPVPNYSPEALINLEVEKWRQKDSKGTDPVEAEILKMLDALDKVLKPVPLPEAVTAERAKKRINDLVAAKPEEPLPVLVEARYYMVKGLLDQSDFAEAAKSLLGEDALSKLKARASEGSQ